VITALAYHLPDAILDNEGLAARFADWSAEKIYAKTGIRTRHIAGPAEFSPDLAYAAGAKIVARFGGIDFLLLCTQTPDQLLPTSACALQARLGLPDTIGALDFNLGCSGFIYGLALAKGMLESSVCQAILLLTADTYSKLLHPEDKGAITVFGDGAAATLLLSSSTNRVHSFVFGTNGAGGKFLTARRGGLRGVPAGEPHAGMPRTNDAIGASDCLVMDGPEVFNFTLQVVPDMVVNVLAKAGLQIDEIDLFVFHQANAFMLEHLRRKLKIPPEKFVLALENFANTVSSTIPIALHEVNREKRLTPPVKIFLAGFGVGLSWAGCILELNEPIVCV
jgi:3-oxoacyl-[acyl-carrier-protein] synthase III